MFPFDNLLSLYLQYHNTKRTTMLIKTILLAYLTIATLTANIGLLPNLANKRIVTLIATNDIHGYVLPKSFVRADNHQTYTHGGLSVLAALIQIARKENPDNTLYFDSGDQFQGGLQSSPLITSGSLLNAYTQYLKVDGAAVGNHQFDFGLSFLENFLSKRKTTTLAANIIKNQESKFLPKQQKSHLYTLQNGIKIGAIGLTTILTPQRSPGWALKDEGINNIEFKKYKEIVQQQSSKLREQGANAVILVTHVGQNYFIDSPKYGIWTNANKAKNYDSNGQIHKLLAQLKKGTIDAVLQGHYHVIAHNYIQGIPVVGNNMGGKYFNILYLQFQQQKIVNTFIQGPIPVCQKVFAKTMQCEYIQSLEQTQAAGDLVNWKFHGTVVKPDEKLEEIFKRQLEGKLKPYLQILCQNQLLLKPSYYQQTELNNLLARAVQSSLPADFTLLAPSLLRQALYPGPIRKIDIYNFHPFNSPFVLIKLRGADFMSALKYLQQNTDSYHFSNQLKQVVSLSENREKKGLLSVSWYNGSQIQPQKQITGIVHNFTLSFIIDKYNITKVKTFGTVRQIFEKYLKDLGRVSKSLGLMDDKNPHLIVKTVPNS